MAQYEDFEPSYEWAQDAESDTLILALKGFKKENLKVQIGTNRRLKLRGEEQISVNKWRRINKEFTIPSHSSINGIKAKLEGGLLYIRLPKNITEITPPTQPYVNQTYARETREAPTPKEPEKGESVSETKEMRKIEEDDKNVDEDRAKPTTSKAKEMHETVNQKLPTTTLYGLVVKQNKLRKLLVAIFLFFAMGIYVKNAIFSAFRGSTIQDP
ncbi:hypothetical protein LR48_Vigan02g031900 [Vigna angularis]|uniref:SHSP domain-containing protein n=2 Tax=Phaseolus angularis TaxID=3914 RepID=A0A0L9TVG1_PHAAN|nr:inactive protein RESTRICTED TEV MOVEMENT 2 [Vigna angularis]KAG2403371.1 uncharacterized protein HKW66_Vig0186580 [Vigna angularis]KOM34169.1 hypothetical protein LR48_Vigan02g031900 [Vigna angularis]BAT96338.1 hypothetical protein VIGAN_08325900 [Vigna angularis var. angularis]